MRAIRCCKLKVKKKKNPIKSNKEININQQDTEPDKKKSKKERKEENEDVPHSAAFLMEAAGD